MKGFLFNFVDTRRLENDV